MWTPPSTGTAKNLHYTSKKKSALLTSPFTDSHFNLHLEVVNTGSMNLERTGRRLTSEVSLNRQIRTVPSQEEVAAKVSNGSKSTLNMGAACPLIMTSRDNASVFVRSTNLTVKSLIMPC